MVVRLSCYLLLAPLFLSGCGAGDPALKAFPIQGTVTLDGEPIPSASILLKDPSGQLRTCVASVENGNLRGTSTAGEKLIEVTAYRLSKNKTVPGADGTGSQPETDQYLPARYNSESKLTATIEAKDNTELDLKLLSK